MSKSLTDSGTTQTAWNQLDQLLNCAICLDRFRNPKLLPCQHTFCMEPCLEGLIDYIRRQIKCPECRAEHRIPYQGIQGYPTNVTLMRFLELHFEVTGETPDPTPTVKERCGVCSEKAYLAACYHCDKKVCPDCKEAHLDILKREIARINNQIRRGLHRLQDALSQSEKSVHLLQQNCCNVTQEIEEVYARLQKELKEREEILKNEVELFLQNELRNLTQLKDNLDIEVANIQSNCELAEKHVNENSEWEDVELVDYKDTFLKTLEFVRNFDPEQAEFNGRLKFQGGPESDAVHTSIANFGELILNCPHYPTNTPNTLSSNLMRSKSDHRLATQFHRQEESRNYLGVGQRFGASDAEGKHDGRSTSPMSRRRVGDTDYRRSITDRARELDEGEKFGSRRYTREFGGNWQRDDTDAGGYRSRYARDDLREGSDPDAQTVRGVRFAKHDQPEATPRERIFDTEDAIKGPLSGIARLMDCPRVIRKLQLTEQHQKQKLEEKSQPPAPVPVPTPVVQQPVRRTQRQASEDDEIAKIKAQNKTGSSTQTSTNTTSTMTTTTASEPPSRPLARRVAALQNKDETSRPTVQLNRTSSREDRGDTSDQSPSSPTQMGRRRTGSRQEESGSEPTTPVKTVMKQTSRDTSTSRDSTPSRPPSRQVSRDGEYKTPPSTPTRKLSTDQKSDTSNDESSVAAKRRFFTRNQSDSRFERPNLKTTTPVPTPIAETPKTSSESDSDRLTSAESTPVHSAPVVEEVKGQDTPNYFRFRNSNHSRTPSNSSVDDTSKSPSTPGSPLFARGRPETPKQHEDAKTERAKSTDSTSSGSSSSESSSSSSPSRTTVPANTKSPAPKKEEKAEEPVKSRFPTVSAREPVTSARSTEAPRVDGRNSPITNRSSTPSYSSRTSQEKQEDPKEATKSKFVSRFLPRQSSSVTDNKDESSSETESETEQAAKEAARDASITALLARSALARRESTGSVLSTPSASRLDSSTSSSRLYNRDRDDTTSSITLRKPSSYLSSRDDKKDGAESRYSSLSSKYLTRGRSTLDDDKDDKYGSYASRYLARSKSSAALSLDRDGSPDDSSRRTGSDRFRKESRFSALRRNRIGRSRSSHDIALHGDDDDDDRDVGTTSYRSSRFDSSSDLARSWSHHALSREQSPEDMSAAAIKSWAKYLKNKYGSKIKEQKAANRDANCNSLNNDDSSDSSDDEGGPLTSIQLGRKIELSKSTTSLNLNIPIGENPRTLYLQKKRMIAKLGERGSDPGCFTWPRGVAVGPDNSIVVADSSNHRIQIFDCCGNFVKEFGSYGNAEGEFDCLAGVAVNRIGQYIISDRYNHRIQVFDPTGRFLRVFGNQGSSDGRFSYPWGVSTDSLGFIYVCDKENNRVQVFQSDGTFVGKFGSLGNKVGQLEHPHYIAVSNTNKVVVSDGSNHRISIFDVNGRIMFCFGSEGSEEGQFKFPRGVAVDDQGYIIVGDSGNNRIQIFNSDGTFLRSFGAWGSGDGEFKGLEGVAVTSNGNILVCDRENHRIQIF